MKEEKAFEFGLKTPFEEDANAWNIHPRPQLKRDAWQSLCGLWRLSAEKKGTETEIGEIHVPFPPESRLSRIERTLRKGEKWVYRKRFYPEHETKGKRVLLHFGAADQIAKVYLNGEYLGEHIGGYGSFTLDVTDALKPKKNDLRVEVRDELDKNLSYGKQRKKRGGMWYTPVSGIWQPVWLEYVPENYIRSLKLTPSLKDITIETEGGNAEKTVTLSGGIIRTYMGDRVTLEIPEPHLWTPEDPYLYEFTLTDGADTIASYFALRTVSVGNANGQAYIFLNGKPRFLHGLLDQGYYSDGIYLPGSPEGFAWDICTMKRLGFDLLRKHAKVEPDIYYALCDKFGMLVWQDMVNSGPYSFLLDTALPTVGIRRGLSRPAGKKRKENFRIHLAETIKALYNHPCVCAYTIFNEGWGQHDADRICRDMRLADPTRIWDTASGWFVPKESDVRSVHVYFRKIRWKKDAKLPQVLSEFGGYACGIAGHVFNLKNAYGYRKFDTPEALSDALEKLYLEEIVPAIRNGLCTAVLTQVSDVEDETNGLVTYDRQVIKVNEEQMQRTEKALREAFQKQITE